MDRYSMRIFLLISHVDITSETKELAGIFHQIFLGKTKLQNLTFFVPIFPCSYGFEVNIKSYISVIKNQLYTK